MQPPSPRPLASPASPGALDALDRALRASTEALLNAALDAEAEQQHRALANLVDADGRRLVVRNGRMPEREIETCLGPLRVRRPRLHERRGAPDGRRRDLDSRILPSYLRRFEGAPEDLRCAFLAAILHGDLATVLHALRGDPPVLDPALARRLELLGERELESWRARTYRGRAFERLWLTAVSRTARVPRSGRHRLLAAIAVDAAGTAEIVSVRETSSDDPAPWQGILVDLRARGLALESLAIGVDPRIPLWDQLLERGIDPSAPDLAGALERSASAPAV
jgi:hypothetical protein